MFIEPIGTFLIREVLGPPATVTPGGAVMLAPEEALVDRRPEVRHEGMAKGDGLCEVLLYGAELVPHLCQMP